MKTLSTAEAGKRLGVHHLTIRRWIDEGLFPNAYRKNPRNERSPYRIPETDVERLEQQRQPATPQ